MSVHFSCTMCGRCCHDLHLPLSVDEALDWIARGGDVQLYCDAIVWPQEPPESDALAQHRRRRSFAAHSGALSVRVAVTLVAAFKGPCPHLGANMACGAYDQRPRVCRIYPAEVNPFVPFDPSGKLCPPDAWSSNQPPLMRAGQLVTPEIDALIAQSRDADQRDRLTKAYLCTLLGYDTAALANEGYAIYAPQRTRVQAALQAAQQAAAQIDDPEPRSPHPWHLITNRAATLSTLRSLSAVAHAPEGVPRSQQTPTYLGFLANDTDGRD
ncbi:YkgJ family cysteine cluster protein [Paraburkholderia azotifigens]|nr:YkgJ family cysteine cluster protein [Paraburkholderia azotifigens]TXC84128.1 YkgJ family cysteine cluster protein [Paraburkholderia azotifigens]